MDEIDTNWRRRGSCTNEDPELFFPVGDSGPGETQLADAKAVCRRCPVREKCLAWALTTGQDFGVWGGMSEDERRALKRRSGASARSGHRRAERARRSSPLASPPATRGPRWQRSSSPRVAPKRVHQLCRRWDEGTVSGAEIVAELRSMLDGWTPKNTGTAGEGAGRRDGAPTGDDSPESDSDAADDPEGVRRG